jgi:ferredoxin-NADP reductase
LPGHGGAPGEVRYTPRMERFPPCAASLTRIEPVARDTLVYTFALERPIPFRAGQFVNMSVPTAKPRPERSYSVFSDPGRPDQLELCIKLLEGGAASEMLRVAKVGDDYSFRGPMGVFTLAADDAPVTFVATGTGIAPYHAMLSEYARLHAEGEAAARSFRVYFGVRDEGDLFLTDVLDGWKRSLPDFDFHICLSRPSASWTQPAGRVTAALAERLPRGEVPVGHFYLCGNGPMIEETKALLLEAGADKKQVHYEKYY